METISNNSEEPLYFSDNDIFTKIWTSPRAVFRYINERQYDKYVPVLLVLAGISRSFDRASVKNMGDNMSIWAIIGFCIIFGGLLGWLSFYIYAALVSWTGTWLRGRGNTNSILRIIAYAMTPSIIALLFLIPQIAIYGVEIFKAEGDISNDGWISDTFYYGTMVLESVLAICTIVFSVIGVSEVQKLSIGKSILNLLLPVLVLLVPILLIITIVKIF